MLLSSLIILTCLVNSGDKFILAVDGDHNEVRPPSMHVQLLCYLLLSSGQSPMQVFVRRFLQRYMQVPAAWALESRQSIFSTLVPWHQTHGRILQETSKQKLRYELRVDGIEPTES